MSPIVGLPAMPLPPSHDAPPEIDRATLERAQAGERAASHRLIRRYQRPVAAVLRRMLRPAGLDSLTEDLAQETFVRAFSALPRFDLDGPGRLSTWLLTIATRLALQQLQRRRVDVEPLEGERVGVAARARANDLADRAALGRAIERAVASLAPPYRAAFVLHEYNGLDYAAIAEVLGVEPGTVKSRLNRARKALRAALAETREALMEDRDV